MEFKFVFLRIALANLIGDLILGCPTILFGEEFFSHSARKQPVYSYRLMQGLEALKPYLPKWAGVQHGMDGNFVFFKSIC